MVCDPPVSAAVLTLALSPTSDEVPSAVVPSKKETVPVGDPVELVTCAVNVTLCPNVEGFRLDASVTVVLA